MPPGRRHAAALALLALLLTAGLAEGQRRGGRKPEPKVRVETFGDVQPERLEATRKLLNTLERHWRLSPAATPRTRQLAELAALATRKVDFVRGRMPTVPGRKRFQYVPMPGLLIGDTEEAARTAAAYFATPENKVAMLQHPEYIPELLRNPDGFVRQTACEAARKGGQSKAIVEAVCAPDNEVPWPVAEALHATDHLNFYHANVDRFRWPQQLSDPSATSLGRSLLSHMPGLEDTMAKAVGQQVEARLRRGLKPHGISARILKTEVVPAGKAPGLKCEGIKSLFEFLWKSAVIEGCLTFECELPVPTCPFLVFKFGVEVCLPYSSMAQCLLPPMGKAIGCEWPDKVDEQLAYALDEEILSSSIGIFGGICFNLGPAEDLLKKILFYIGIDTCLAQLKIIAWPLKFQGGFELSVSLPIVYFGIQGKMQFVAGTNHLYCLTVKRDDYGPGSLWRRYVQCKDFCAWKPGDGDLALLAGIKRFFFRAAKRVRPGSALLAHAAASNAAIDAPAAACHASGRRSARHALKTPAPVHSIIVQIPIPGAGTVVPECEKPPKPCSKGEVYNWQLKTCQACPYGSYAPDDYALGSCIPAPAGSFVPKQKATKADLAPCPVNTFQQFTAQASCQPCPPGTWTGGRTGAVLCEICPAGYFCEGGQPGAKNGPCPRGRWNPNPGATSMAGCLCCPVGHKGPEEGRFTPCEKCPLPQYARQCSYECYDP